MPITSEIELDSCSDLFDARNYIQLAYLSLLSDVKQSKKSLDDMKSVISGKLALVRRLAARRPIHDFCKDTLIDMLLLSGDCLLKMADRSSSTKALLQDVFKLTKSELFDNDPNAIASLREKWQLAEFYCNMFEFSRSSESLAIAYDQIRKNPAPLLYRRICMNLFNNESDPLRRIMHLFETQSIALRHKACSIQLKQKRKVLFDFWF